MKKVLLSLMLSLGVGFAMMGSPAQVSDDNAGGATVQVAANRQQPTVRHGRFPIKHEWHVKKNVEFVKNIESARWIQPKEFFGDYGKEGEYSSQMSALCTHENAHKSIIRQNIIKDPIPIKDKGHINTPPPIVGPEFVVDSRIKPQLSAY